MSCKNQFIQEKNKNTSNNYFYCFYSGNKNTWTSLNWTCHRRISKILRKHKILNDTSVVYTIFLLKAINRSMSKRKHNRQFACFCKNQLNYPLHSQNPLTLHAKLIVMLMHFNLIYILSPSWTTCRSLNNKLPSDMITFFVYFYYDKSQQGADIATALSF